MIFTLVTLALAAPPHPKPGTVEAELLVWSGAKDRATAEAQAAGLAGLVEALAPFVEISPTVVESAKVRGLNPGFFVVTLGACSPGQASAAVQLVHTLRPLAYTRTVELEDEQVMALRCPTFVLVDAPDTDEPVRWRLEAAERVDLDAEAGLAGLSFAYDWQQNGDFAQSFSESRAVFAIVEASGAVRAVEVPDGTSDAATGKLSRRDTTLRFDVEYAEPRCDPSGDRFVAWTRGWTASVVDGGLRVEAPEPVQVREGTCGYAEEHQLYEVPGN